MNERLQRLRDYTQARSFCRCRQDVGGKQIQVSGSEAQRNLQLFVARCRSEKAIVLPDERITFTRTLQRLSQERPGWTWSRIVIGLRRRLPPSMRFLFGKSTCRTAIHNVCPDYGILMRHGLNGLRTHSPFASSAIDALLELVLRYAQEAERVGNVEISALLRQVPAEPPKSFHEALQSIRIVSSALHLADAYQCGFGRMDQYLWPIYKADIDSGRLTRESALELVEEFFISLNRDADLYVGVQQGDNGQSIMLGGCDPKTGEDAINDLTYLMMEAARETRLIDPKINLRVNRDTPLDLLELGSSLTQCGLGFPQYSNDEVVIPALVKKGYALEDARNYSVAACWEFIIPGRGFDVVNQGAVSFPYAVDSALRAEVAKGEFDESRFRQNIVDSIRGQVDAIVRGRDTRLKSSPFVELLFDEIRYRNVGVHGAGAANAADAMAAIRHVFIKSGFKGLCDLVIAEDCDFKEKDKLLSELTNECHKVGNADSMVDAELKFLFDSFADVADRVRLPKLRAFERPRVLRPGCGTAQYYVWLTDLRQQGKLLEPVVGATAEGRHSGASLAASLAPSHESRVDGVLSVFKSFSGIDYQRIMNGGPVTIELSHTVFDSPEGVRKLAQLIQYFVKLGLHQLQLNVLDVNQLKDAIEHPERHRNLIVRVWGWSGYFCELSPEYQKQIIRRHCYG